MATHKNKGEFFFRKIGLFFTPRWTKNRIRRISKRLGHEKISFRLFGTMFLIVEALCTLSGTYVLGIMGTILGLVAGVILFCIIQTGIILLFNYLAYNRVQNIERNLPLFLHDFAINLRAGREFVDALSSSLSEELGPLNEDLSQLVVEIKSGMMTEKALLEYGNRYDSYTLKEIFTIIVESYRGGGELSDIVEKIAENLELVHYLKKSAVASVSNYIIFISIVALVISPLLFSLSNNLLILINKLIGRVLSQTSSSIMPATVMSVNVDFDEFILFSRIAVSVIAGSAAAIIGTISKGSLRGSLGVILSYIAISNIAYQVFLLALNWVFNVLFTTI
ncbi:type II secretion system F family protein [Candidatus Woesearchaeota archaeon]|nr:type II secretion system F family protein [Candidatus Woesearchaeota archaeon]